MIILRTSKAISTISYNSKDFLLSILDKLIRQHIICNYMFIEHQPEDDERKKHIHLFIQPNRLIDTMELQDMFKEFDSSKPDKPLGCIDFRLSKIDDWILYNQHFNAYLLSKGESRKFHYARDDFVYFDSDTFDFDYNHAFKGSEWAKRNQILQTLNNDKLKPIDLILNGTLPLNMASQLNAFEYMKKNKTFRGEYSPHE